MHSVCSFPFSSTTKIVFPVISRHFQLIIFILCGTQIKKILSSAVTQRHQFTVKRVKMGLTDTLAMDINDE